MSGSAILTNNGLLKIASASPLDQLTITQIAIGDGVNPLDPNSTALVNEVYRDAASTPIRSTTYPNTLVFELNIPPTTGGFTCREIGAFDTDGDLIAVGTLDELVKPADGINYVARINVKLANATQVDVFYDNQGAIDHSGLRNRNAVGAHDDIYTRNFKNVADLRNQIDATGNVIDLSSLSDNKVYWRGYYQESDGGSNWGIVKTGDSTSLNDDGGSVFIIVNDSVNGVWVEANLKGKSINVKKFGTFGDGVNDDTSRIQAAASYSNKRKLVFGDNDYIVSDQITLPNNIEIDCRGNLILDGDTDFWFFAPTSCEKITIHNFTAEVVSNFADRIELNRVIRVEEPGYFEVKKATITGASTAVHCLGGDDFVCGDITLFNTYGTEAQYGYGVNSSAKRTTIKSIKSINDSSDDGRHMLYINGNGSYIPEFVHVEKIYVKNCSANPINIAVTSANTTYMTIDSATLINANMKPTVSSTGAIHCGDESDNVALSVGTLIYSGGAGCAFGNQSASNKGVSLGKLIATNLPPAYYTNTALVYCRFTQNLQIGDIDCDGLNTDWLSALYFRDVDGTFDSVDVRGSLGEQAVRLVDSSVLVGDIRTESIDRKFNSGSTQTYKQLQQRYTYANAAPTTGSWERGDITWRVSVSAGDSIGWVCTASGTPGTWKEWGDVEL